MFNITSTTPKLPCIPIKSYNYLSLFKVHVIVHRNKFIFNKTSKTHKFPKFYFVKKKIRVSGISFDHHREFSTVHSALVSFTQVFDDRFQAESGWNCRAEVWWQLPSRVILTLLGSCHQTCKKCTNAECTVENSWWWAKEMPEIFRVFWRNKIWEIRASCWFY
jgi:hypothetical protein